MINYNNVIKGREFDSQWKKLENPLWLPSGNINEFTRKLMISRNSLCNWTEKN